ncbi:amidohydrolase family protein [Pseudomonas aeruginosa]
MIAGKVLMDRNGAAGAVRYCGQWLRREPRADRALARQRAPAIRCVTPRFAPTSSPEQLAAAARLLDEYPGVYLHTHLSENLKEVAWVGELFPQAQDYLDVSSSRRPGRRTQRVRPWHPSLRTRMPLPGAQERGAGALSQFQPVHRLRPVPDLGRAQQVLASSVGIGSDVGGGTSLSLLANLADAYKIQQLRGTSLDPFQALYLATLGGARAPRPGRPGR